jgi:hypothetical protein
VPAESPVEEFTQHRCSAKSWRPLAEHGCLAVFYAVSQSEFNNILSSWNLNKEISHISFSMRGAANIDMFLLDPRNIFR